MANAGYLIEKSLGLFTKFDKLKKTKVRQNKKKISTKLGHYEMKRENAGQRCGKFNTKFRHFGIVELTVGQRWDG